MANKEVKEDLKSCLRNESVIVRRINKFNNGITDKRHPMYGGMLENAEIKIAPKMMRNGSFTNVLTTEEKEFLESYMHTEENELSMYNKKYWGTLFVTLRKDDMILNLADPDDYIKYKILVTHTDFVAPNLEEQYRKASYRYVLIHQNEEANQQKGKISKKSRAYMKYGVIENDADALKYVIKMLSGRTPATNSKLLTLQNAVGEFVESQTDNFIRLLEDTDFNMKVFIDKGLRAGAINRRQDEYYTLDNKPMLVSGDKATLDQAVKFLNSPENQEVKFTIEARIEAARE